MKIALLPATLLTCAVFIAAGTVLAQPWAVTNTPPPRPVTTFAPPVTQLAPAKPVVAPPPQQPPQALGQLADGVLAFDALSQDYTSKPGEMEAKFSFNVTNVSSGDVTVSGVQTSCGCTVAHLTYPWIIPAGGSGVIPLTMNLMGKSGTVFKSATVLTDKGQKMLTVKVTIAPPAADPISMGADREKNRLIATQDRQAVFKGDCARCHVAPVIGLMGKVLYDKACGICHEDDHRATMVPDLHALKTVPNAEFWRFSVVHGKPGTLMPAFAQSEGGPLSEPQIASLVDYLVKEFPASKTNAPNPHADHAH
jgi:mono/diheme cytochrome c family protein